VTLLPQGDRNSAAIRLRTILEVEFARRRKLNLRYSLRAFAQSAHIEHSTLSQLLRGKRPLTWKSIRRIAGRVRWTGAAVLHLSTQESRFDSRAIARRLGVSVDEVNIAFTDLCLFGLLQLKGT
jgi:transcriptional regulator with XRE-family HTH domain